jgi:hypothetical protein
MRIPAFAFLALLCAAPVFPQNPTAPAPQAPAPKPVTPQTQAPQTVAPPATIRRPAYVRRFSIGATLTVTGLSPIPKKETNIVTTGPAVDSLYTTTPASQRIGYGVNAQVAVTERFAVNASLLFRRAGYQMDTSIIEGVDISTTPGDERRFTTKHEDTRVRFADLPVLIRYYGKDRHEEGPRWFLEGGVVLRRARDVRTSVYSRVGTADTTCCDFTPAPVHKRTARGAVVGAGFQLIDQIGIRVVPEVRYTRWVSETFSRFSTVSRRDQIEGMLSLTF